MAGAARAFSVRLDEGRYRHEHRAQKLQIWNATLKLEQKDEDERFEPLRNLSGNIGADPEVRTTPSGAITQSCAWPSPRPGRISKASGRSAPNG